MSTALTSSKGPFVARDSAGTLQKIKVIDLPNYIPNEDYIAGYSYIEATGSTYDLISSSVDVLATASIFLQDISSSVSASNDSQKEVRDGVYEVRDAINGITASIDHITASVDRNTSYVEQVLKFHRGTHLHYKRFGAEELFDLSSSLEAKPPNTIHLHMHEALNPAVSTTDRENYMSKAVQVIIQNSTNRNLFLGVSYNPDSPLSEQEYTIKIPPGVIYNSESQIAHIRHKIRFADDGYINPQFVGEVAVSIVYNESINVNMMIGQTGMGIPYVSTVATNYFNMPFSQGGTSPAYVLAEWYFQSGSTPSSYNSFNVSGQARVTYPYAIDPVKDQSLTLYVTKDGNNVPYDNATYTITSETPTPFSLEYVAPPTGRYELIAVLSGSGDIGDARVLYADLIRRKLYP